MVFCVLSNQEMVEPPLHLTSPSDSGNKIPPYRCGAQLLGGVGVSNLEEATMYSIMRDWGVSE